MRMLTEAFTTGREARRIKADRIFFTILGRASTRPFPGRPARHSCGLDPVAVPHVSHCHADELRFPGHFPGPGYVHAGCYRRQLFQRHRAISVRGSGLANDPDPLGFWAGVDITLLDESGLGAPPGMTPSR